MKLSLILLIIVLTIFSAHMFFRYISYRRRRLKEVISSDIVKNVHNTLKAVEEPNELQRVLLAGCICSMENDYDVSSCEQVLATLYRGIKLDAPEVLEAVKSIELLGAINAYFGMFYKGKEILL